MKLIIDSMAGLKDLSVKKVYYLLFSVLFITSLYSCKSGNTNENQNRVPTTDTLVAVRDSLQSQLTQARYQIDQFMSKVGDLEKDLGDKNVEIGTLDKDVTHYKKSDRTLSTELKNARKMLASLKEKVKSFQDQIAALERDKDQALADKDNLQKKYDDLKELGSVLHASNIRVMAMHLKRSGKEKKTARARRANLLQVHFDIDENRIAEDGTKKLYIAIKSPDGNMIGGSTLNTHDGTSVNYSMEKDVALRQNEPVKDITVDWKQDGGYKKGIYDVEIYNGGYPIGEGTVALK